ncbi:glycosyltransferase [Pseudomonas sp. sp1636]|uniref:glycosyltransferase n=1 Tax=Pseudomonas sp. sp1636 TaxID=3036707 RepID=UPI0025A57B03|nr:glycosyltransferase [Pseudomonas sp. sp1636]MDM8349795.1 glycosyltransferase [Pseudomonas sp. sp1636]
MSVKDLPLVSVAVITYNQKKFLRECIESILEQDYPNLEIVVADDGSIDGTQEMLRDYDGQYPGKFVLKLAEKNQGITANSNAAHFACTGKYIAWMGGDDLMLPGKVRKQVKYMEANPNCTICYHDLDVFDSDSNTILYYFSKRNKPRQGDVRTSIKYGVFNGACSTMVRSDKAPVHGYNLLLPVASDWCYWVESLVNGGSIDYLNEVLGRYRRHSGNVTNKAMHIGQNVIDHLNTCNFIMAKYPAYFKEVMHCYGVNIRTQRRYLPYVRSLLTSFKLSADFKSLGALVVYILTIGLIRI